MEEQTTPSPEYLKGFNEGYTLGKEVPHLSDKLSQIKNNSDRIKGFHDGRRHFLLEKARDQRIGYAQDKLTNENKKTSRSKEQDLDKE